jgi:peptidoglycan/LPS O-acetylase OafA/YrhL
MVIGYHFQINAFKNGFVGVDIFLVISGYLIGNQALLRLQANQFSVAQFLQMRLRRIYPALYLIVMVSVLLGWQFSLPSEYLRQLRQAMSALAFVSNIAFGNDSGYFSAAAQTKPLLHTWSLSVEWQFYLFFPALLLFLALLLRSGSRMKQIGLCLGLLASVSFAWCLWQSAQDSGSSFFSLRARAWELLVGCMIACYEIIQAPGAPPRTTSQVRTWVALLGWTVLGACFFANMSESHWPGPYTALPVLGAMLVIAARAHSLGSAVLNTAVVQRLGDWSYSLYLWHWPLWVFLMAWLSVHGSAINGLHKLLLFSVTLALSFASFKWVEQPFRTNKEFWTARRLVWFSLAGLLSLVLVSAVIFALQGVPQRLPAYIQRAELARSVNTPRDECFRDARSEKTSAAPYCEFGAKGQQGAPSLILWGDSIANQYLDPLTRAAVTHNYHGLIATQSGCRAFIEEPGVHFGVPERCHQFNRDVLALLRDKQGPELVVLARNWGAADEVTPLISTLLDWGKTVVLVLPSIGLDFDVPEKWIEMQYRADKAIDDWPLAATPQLLQAPLRTQIAKAILPFRSHPRYVEIDPLPVVCAGSFCYPVRNGQANFRDTLHISNLNSEMYDGLFNDALAQSLRARRQGPSNGP